MSDKWRRSKAWDDANLTGPLFPIKLVFRAFSSISLAVVLLTLVVLYATLASVPVGLLALAPTYAFYAATVALAVLIGAAMPATLVFLASRRAGPLVRFPAALFTLLALGVACVWVWARYAWPALHYDPASEEGVRFFAGFVAQYESTTIRRLPGIEMSELEFYSWWPMRAILMLFVINMVVATVRRIEFNFLNVGVLTVHTGIVVMALGSIYYNALKKEGDTILLAGSPMSTGQAHPGPAQRYFHDNTHVALYISHMGRVEQRPLRGVPRYNDYNLSITPGVTASQASGRRPLEPDPPERDLDIEVPEGMGEVLDAGIRFRIVGYAHYAEIEPEMDWLRVDPSTIHAVHPGMTLNPIQFLKLHLDDPDEAEERTSFAWTLAPNRATDRVSRNSALGVESAEGMDPVRWRDLTEPLGGGAQHGLVIEIPAANTGEDPIRVVQVVTPEQEFEVGGYRFRVDQLADEPPFPIITPGYQNATSSLAIVRVTAPDGRVFTRWVYHRFPEISQDFLEGELSETGQPKRVAASDEIRIGYIDASRMQVYTDRREDGTYGLIIRRPRGSVLVREGLSQGDRIEEIVPRLDPTTEPKLDLEIAERWDHAEPFERPVPTPTEEQTKSRVGTHDRAKIAIEIAAETDAGPWSRIVWVPFMKYMTFWDEVAETVLLPDARPIRVGVGRLQHRFPGFQIRMTDFEMVAYDHRGAPRDYRSTVRVEPGIDAPAFAPYEHVTSLNYPLQAPFMKNDQRGWASNTIGHLASRLKPTQFKLSQSGWDQQGWNQSQQLVDQGLLDEPRVTFTILHIGNNPGIHVIALGGILMALGIPWAFYVKPALVQRRKKRIQREIAESSSAKPNPSESDQSSPEPAGAAS